MQHGRRARRRAATGCGCPLAPSAAEGKPIPVGVLDRRAERPRSAGAAGSPRHPAGKPPVIEFEFDLAKRQSVRREPAHDWDIREFKKPIEEYTGPGLLVEWMKIEGPIDAFPPPSYRRLFAGVPLKARSVAKAENEGTHAAEDRRQPLASATGTSDPLVPASANPQGRTPSG